MEVKGSKFLVENVIFATKFLHHLGTGCCFPKTTFRTKLGARLRQGSIQKIWDPCVFLQPLKLATSHLVHKLGLGLTYQKTTFRTKIGGGLGQGNIQQKFGTPYLFLQPLKLATSNLVHNYLGTLSYLTVFLISTFQLQYFPRYQEGPKITLGCASPLDAPQHKNFYTQKPVLCHI